jgi:hypothetical protein
MPHSPAASPSRFIALLLAGLLFFTFHLTAWSQTPGHTKLNVKNRVQLEIPDDWTINDAEHRERVRDYAAKVTGTSISHSASLSAQSYPQPSRVFVRVSFITLEPPITQADVRREVQADRQQVIRDLADTWREESPIMWRGLAKNGVKEVGQPSFAIEPLGGQTAMVIRYARTSTVNPAETMKVAQYHVVLGAEKALITLSYIDGDRTAMAAHDRLKSTLSIR